MIQSESVLQWKAAMHEAVKQAIRNSDKTQVAIAKELEIGQSQVSAFLHSPTEKVILERLLTVADKLGVPFALTLSEPPPEFHDTVVVAEEVEEAFGNA